MLRMIIYLFYSYFLITGGFRNYTEELEMRNFIENLNIADLLVQLVSLAELLGIICAFFILIFPHRKYLHLAFFGIFFPLSLSFQHFLFLEKYLIVIDFIPLIFFFLIHFNTNGKKNKQFKTIIIRLISIGFITSLISKTSSYWLNPDFFAVKTIAYNFNYFFEGTVFSVYLTQISSSVFHKICDYSVLLLQSAALIVFFKPVFFRSYSVFLVLFHTLILLTFNFYFFFPFILLYTLCIKDDPAIHNLRSTGIIAPVIVLSLFILLSINGFDKFFIINTLHIPVDMIGKIYFIISLLVYFYSRNNYLYRLMNNYLFPSVRKLNIAQLMMNKNKHR